MRLIILKLLLNTRMVWMIFTKVFKNIVQIRHTKYWSHYSKKFNPIVIELFIRGRKLKISLVFITQTYFAAPKNIRRNFTRYFIIKLLNKRKLQQSAFNYSSDIGYEDFLNFYKYCTAKPYSFIADVLALDNPACFKNIF